MDRQRQEILEQVLRQLPSGATPDLKVGEESSLAELGLTSLHLITTLLELQRQFGLSEEWCAPVRMPSTVGELVTLVECGLPAALGKPEHERYG